MASQFSRYKQNFMWVQDFKNPLKGQSANFSSFYKFNGALYGAPGQNQCSVRHFKPKFWAFEVCHRGR